MSRHSKLVFIVLSVFMLGIIVAGCSHFKKDQEKPSIDLAEELSFTATVEAIDYDTRHVTLKGPQGKTMTFYVNEEAYNFKEVEAGDLVDITYYAAIAINLENAAKDPSFSAGAASARAPEGQKPEGVAYNVMDVRAVVVDIDYENRTVDLRGPRNNVITVEVDEKVKNFKNIKKGDEVVAKYTEAVAVSVRPADKK